MDTYRAIEELSLFSPVREFWNKSCRSTMPQLTPLEEAKQRLAELRAAGWTSRLSDVTLAEQRIAAARMRTAIGVAKSGFSASFLVSPYATMAHPKKKQKYGWPI